MNDVPNVAFLGYDESQTSISGFLRNNGVGLQHTSGPVEDLSAFEAVISFGYRHILKPHVLATARRPVLNLHISYLPYNRGAHPNFWSWMDGTPSGVTIHEIDHGIDTGPIIAQEILSLDPDGLTFRETHAMLFRKMEQLFIECWSEIIDGTYRAVPQSGSGSFHRVTDLPEWMDSWDMQITDAVARHRRAG